MTKHAIFDVCWTLYRSNTTVDFVLFYLKKTKYKRFVFFRFLTYRPIARILTMLTNIDLREIIIDQLKDCEEVALKNTAELFYCDFLGNRKNEIVFSDFQKLKKQNYEICLASASLDVVVSTIAKHNDVNFVSSRLGYMNGLCTGKLVLDATSKKYDLLQEKYGLNYFDVMYTDNAEDLDIRSKFSVFKFILNTSIKKSSKIIEK